MKKAKKPSSLLKLSILTPLAILFASSVAFAEDSYTFGISGGVVDSTTSVAVATTTEDVSIVGIDLDNATLSSKQDEYTYDSIEFERETVTAYTEYTYTGELDGTEIVFTATRTDANQGVSTGDTSTFSYTCTVGGDTVEANTDGSFTITSEAGVSYVVSITEDGTPSVLAISEVATLTVGVVGATEGDTTALATTTAEIALDDSAGTQYTYTATVDGVEVVFTATTIDVTVSADSVFAYTYTVAGEEVEANDDGTITINGTDGYTVVSLDSGILSETPYTNVEENTLDFDGYQTGATLQALTEVGNAKENTYTYETASGEEVTFKRETVITYNEYKYTSTLEDGTEIIFIATTTTENTSYNSSAEFTYTCTVNGVEVDQNADDSFTITTNSGVPYVVSITEGGIPSVGEYVDNVISIADLDYVNIKNESIIKADITNTIDSTITVQDTSELTVDNLNVTGSTTTITVEDTASLSAGAITATSGSLIVEGDLTADTVVLNASYMSAGNLDATSVTLGATDDATSASALILTGDLTTGDITAYYSMVEAANIEATGTVVLSNSQIITEKLSAASVALGTEASTEADSYLGLSGDLVTGDITAYYSQIEAANIEVAGDVKLSSYSMISATDVEATGTLSLSNSAIVATKVEADSVTLGTVASTEADSYLALSGNLVTGAITAYYSQIEALNVEADSVELNNASLTASALTSTSTVSLNVGSLDLASLTFNLEETTVGSVALSAEGDTSIINIDSLVMNLDDSTILSDTLRVSGQNYGGDIDVAATYTLVTTDALGTETETSLSEMADAPADTDYTYYTADTVNYAVDADDVVYTYDASGAEPVYTLLADGETIALAAFSSTEAYTIESSTSIGSVELNADGLSLSDDLTITLGFIGSNDENTTVGDAVVNISGDIDYNGKTLTINVGEVEGESTLNVFKNEFIETKVTETTGSAVADSYTVSVLGSDVTFERETEETWEKYTYTAEINGVDVICTATRTDDQAGIGDSADKTFSYVCTVDGEEVEANSDGDFEISYGSYTYVVSITEEGVPTVVETNTESPIAPLVFTATVNDFDNVNIDNNVSIEGSVFNNIDNVAITGATFANTESTFDNVDSIALSGVSIDTTVSLNEVESLNLSDVSASETISLNEVESLTLSNFTSTEEDAFKLSADPLVTSYVYTSVNGETYDSEGAELQDLTYKYSAPSGAYLLSPAILDAADVTASAISENGFTYVDANGDDQRVESGDTNLSCYGYDAEGELVLLESTDDTTVVARIVYEDNGIIYADIELADLSLSYVYSYTEEGETYEIDSATISYTSEYDTYSTINIDGNVAFSGDAAVATSSTAYYVDENLMLAGNVSTTYTYTGEDYDTDSANITLNAIEADASGVINLADGTTVSATIVDTDGNLLDYGNALTNEHNAETDAGLTLYIDGTVTIYGNITANSPLTINGVTSEESGTLVVAGGVISADAGTDLTIGSDLSVVLTTDENGTMASFGDLVDSVSVADGSTVTVEASSSTIAGTTYDLGGSAGLDLTTFLTLDEGMSIDADGNLVFDTVSYFTKMTVNSGNEYSLASSVDAMTGADATKITAFRDEVEANGLDSYIVNSNSRMAEVNTMLLSNLSFANTNRARAILAKNNGAYLVETTEADVVKKATGVTANDVDHIKNSPLAQLQSINLLGSKNGDYNAAGYDYYSVGATANIDSFLSDNFLVGVSLGGTYNKVEGDDGDNANSTAFLLNAYAVYALDSLNIFANVGYAHFWNEGSKAGAGSAEWDSDAFNFNLGVSYAIETGVKGLSFSPLAMLDLVLMNSDSASYANGVKVDSESYTSAKFIVGIEATYAFTNQFAASLKALYSYEMADTSYDNTYSLTAADYTLGGINYYGSETGESSAIIGAGLSYDFSKTCSAYFDYTAYIYETLTTHSLNLSVALKF